MNMDSEPQNTDDALNDYVYWLAGSDEFSQKGTGICFAARTSGLYRSEDGGLTWHPAYASLGINEPLPTMAVATPGDFETEQSVFAGVIGGILRSRDGGISWESIQLPAPPPAIVAMIASPNYPQDGMLFAGTMEDGVLCSADRGRHWVAWNFGLFDLNVLCFGISPNFASDETLFAGTQTGLFRSTNGGRAWREVDLPIGF